MIAPKKDKDKQDKKDVKEQEEESKEESPSITDWVHQIAMLTMRTANHYTP